MSRSSPLKRTPISELRRQLDADEFIQLLTRTTLFRKIPPATLPMAILDDVCKTAKVIPLLKNRVLKIHTEDPNEAFICEILSGYVKIYDRPLLKSETRLGLIKNPPALLAWRVPGELLGDFQFTLPEVRLDDHIVATDDCRLLKLPANVARKIAQTYPQLYLNVASNLCAKAIKARIRAQILRLPNIESMVAKLFIELLDERKIDPAVRGARVINGTFRVDDIAAFLGYEYHSTQSGIQHLIRDGLLGHYKNKKSGRFEISNEKGLSQFVARELAKVSKQKR